MSASNIIRAWKDETYRNSLSATELANLPENPIGLFELTAEELALVAGADRSDFSVEIDCCSFQRNCGRPSV